jgi:REP element-mobilizing transposase RayT
MVRGLERRALFRDDADRRDFVERLGAACTASGTRVFAWALLPNHAHVLLASGVGGLSALMRRVLTGYAGMFNRRHRRHGYLFQNRFKSILVEEEPYLLELVRYIHLNPLRAGILHDMSELDRYEWTGHARLIGWRSARPGEQDWGCCLLAGFIRRLARRTLQHQRHAAFDAEVAVRSVVVVTGRAEHGRVFSPWGLPHLAPMFASAAVLVERHQEI